MDHDRFIELVAEAAGVDREQAERATRATLETIAERITRGERRDLADELPRELAPYLNRGGPDAEPFDVDEFLRRVAQREGVDAATAERHARAVFTALGQAIAPKELSDMAAQLSKDFAPLLPTGRPAVEAPPPDDVVLRVAELAGIDAGEARCAADAVLETLAQRIAAGEVEDLVSRLPAALHAPLKRGVEGSGEPARRMSLAEFLRHVAEREGVDPATAKRHTRAVLQALRETVGDDEFFDVTVQLPNDYVTELVPR